MTYTASFCLISLSFTHKELCVQLVQSHLLLKLADEAEGKGRRGRKRKNGEVDDDDKDKEVDDGREVEREDRAKQREMMKEMRARRAAEKLVEAKFGDEVSKQRSRAKQVGQEIIFLFNLHQRCLIQDPKPPPTKGKENGRKGRVSPVLDSNSDSDSPPPSDDESGSEDEDLYRPPREPRTSSAPRSTFPSALIRAGVKSTKDSTLKEEKKSLKDLMVERPLVRKTPGLLLHTAGTGLLNKAGGVKAKESLDGEEVPEKETLSFGTNSGISFGLWGGHLSVDQSAGNSSLNSAFDDKPFSLLGKDKKDQPVKKVFSNWGGDFFKKNLDYRANTNKILEKMQLSKSALGDLNGTGS